jgi:white-opaque regulator 2
MKVDELVALAGTPFPTAGSSPPTAELIDEMVKLYYEVYVPGLSLFFETQWYNIPKDQAASVLSAATLPNNQQLTSLLASFIQSISKIKGTDPAEMVESGHLETAVVWALARLPLCAGNISGEGDVSEARSRLQVFETLISGETLTHNPLAPPIDNNMHPLKLSELEFWYHLAQYLLQSHSAASGGSIREHSLATMRSLLDGRENRDVLYSIAVLREYTALWPAISNEQTVGAHLEESDARCKLAVATRFIRDESASTGGTTNVVRRFADLACRAFVKPGVNVVRRAP